MGSPSHSHEWRPDPARWYRLRGDVYEDPVACACGATAWTHTWCGERNYTDVVEPAGIDLFFLYICQSCGTQNAVGLIDCKKPGPPKKELGKCVLCGDGPVVFAHQFRDESEKVAWRYRGD